MFGHRFLLADPKIKDLRDFCVQNCNRFPKIQTLTFENSTKLSNIAYMGTNCTQEAEDCLLIITMFKCRKCCFILLKNEIVIFRAYGESTLYKCSLIIRCQFLTKFKTLLLLDCLGDDKTVFCNNLNLDERQLLLHIIKLKIEEGHHLDIQLVVASWEQVDPEEVFASDQHMLLCPFGDSTKPMLEFLPLDPYVP